jgi:hypothetical protein
VKAPRVVGTVWRFAHWSSGAVAIVNTICVGGLVERVLFDVNRRDRRGFVVCETCKYQGLEFLDFLRSGMRDIADYANKRCKSSKKKASSTPD